MNTTNTDFIAEFQLDGTLIPFLRHRQESQDAAGIGIVVSRVDDTTTINSGTDQRFTAVLKDTLNITAGAHNLDLVFAASSTLDDPTIYRSIITVKRVS